MGKATESDEYCNTNVQVISSQLSSLQVMTDQKQLGNVEYLSCCGNMITIDKTYAWEVRSRIAMEKAAFKKRKALFSSKWDLTL